MPDSKFIPICLICVMESSLYVYCICMCNVQSDIQEEEDTIPGPDCDFKLFHNDLGSALVCRVIVCIYNLIYNRRCKRRYNGSPMKRPIHSNGEPMTGCHVSKGSCMYIQHIQLHIQRFEGIKGKMSEKAKCMFAM